MFLTNSLMVHLIATEIKRKKEQFAKVHLSNVEKEKKKLRLEGYCRIEYFNKNIGKKMNVFFI